MVKVLYIAGYGRSGSTIMDICLSQHDKVSGLGELSNIFIEWENLKSHPKWKDILFKLEGKFTDISIKELDLISRKVEQFPLLMISKKSLQIYKDFWGSLFKELSEQDIELYVDSSKTSRKTLFRPKRLESIGIQVNIIYLYRPFKKVFKSIKKGDNVKLEKKIVTKADTKFIVKSLLGYVFTVITSKILYSRRYTKISFENFLKKPSSILNCVVKNSNLHYQDDMFVEMVSSFGISGNRTRRFKVVTLKK